MFAAAYAGLLVVDLATRQIMDANAAAGSILGILAVDLVGRIGLRLPGPDGGRR